MGTHSSPLDRGGNLTHKLLALGFGSSSLRRFTHDVLGRLELRVDSHFIHRNEKPPLPVVFANPERDWILYFYKVDL